MLDSLRRCPESRQSDLYVFSDGPKSEQDNAKVAQVRALIGCVPGFRSVTLIPSEENKGLSRSVIEGVSELLEKHESLIVLEDDLEVSSDFLTFMNESLEAYRDRKDIWSISGYTPAIAIPSDYPHDVFLVQRPQCWGWATWSDRWNMVDWDAKQSIVLKDRLQRASFNEGGNDLSRMLDIWKHGQIDVWAIRWVFSAWLHHTWTVNPTHSKVRNIGCTALATHKGWNDRRHDVLLTDKPSAIAPDVLPDERICKSFKAHHDLTWVSKIGYFLRCHNLGYKFIKRLIS